MLLSSGPGGITWKEHVFQPGRAVWTELRASTFRQSCPKRKRRVRPGPSPVTHDFPLCSGVCLFKQTSSGSTLQSAVLDREVKWTCSVGATPPCWGQGRGTVLSTGPQWCTHGWLYCPLPRLADRDVWTSKGGVWKAGYCPSADCTAATQTCVLGGPAILF